MEMGIIEAVHRSRGFGNSSVPHFFHFIAEPMQITPELEPEPERELVPTRTVLYEPCGKRARRRKRWQRGR